MMQEKKEHLPVYGVGPVYGVLIIAATVAACILTALGMFDRYKIENGKVAFILLGILLMAGGFLVWFKAAFRIDKYIKSNELCTDGIYGWVRNPCYSGILLMCTGVLFLFHNVGLLILPVVYWLFLTILMKQTEEKWLADLYGQTYVEYCREVNRAIPFPGSTKDLYETKISDARWIFYDIPGNVGWLMYTEAIIQIAVKQPEYLENPVVANLFVAGWLPLVFYVIAIGELLSERMLKLDRVLSQKRLFRGFGSLVMSAILGLLVSVPMLVINLENGYGIAAQRYVVELLAGSILLLLFGWLLFRGYKRI